MLLKSLTLKKPWMDKYPLIYTADLDETCGNLIKLYISMLDSIKYNYFKNQPLDKFNTVEIIINNQSKKNFEVGFQLADYYATCSWYLLFASRFHEAENYSRKALSIDSISLWARATLAHSLLLQGRFNEALKTYEYLKFSWTDRISGTDMCLDNLDDLEKHRIFRKDDFAKIREFLKAR